MKNIIDFLSIIANGKDNFINLSNANYSRIGSRQVQSSTVLTDDEKAKLDNAIAKARTADELKKAIDESNSILSDKKEIPFEGDYSKARIIGMNFHNCRANVSLKVRIDGNVMLPEERPQDLPETIETSIFRSYTVIRNGEINMSHLKLNVNRDTALELLKNGYIQKFDTDIDIDLDGMPVCENARTFEKHFEDVINEMKAKARKKVWEHFIDESESGTDRLEQSYGMYNAEYLKGIGITSRGFNPQTTSVEKGETMSYTEYKDKVKGMSSVPSFNAFMKKLEKYGKKEVLEDYLNAIENEMLDTLTDANANDNVDYFKAQLSIVNKAIGEYERNIASDRIDWVVNGFNSLDNAVEVDGETFQCSLEKSVATDEI